MSDTNPNDTGNASNAGVNTNAMAPQEDASKFLGASFVDGEKQEPAAKPAVKDTNGKTPAAPKAEYGDDGEKPHRSAQKRIDQLTAQKRAAERRADLLEANNNATNSRLAALEARLAAGGGTGVDKGSGATTSDGESAPDPAKFEYGELDARFIRALAKFEAKQEIAAANKEKQTQEAATKSAENARARNAALDEWAAKAPKNLSDFDEVVVQGARDELWPLSETLGQLIQESDVGHAIAYALASDVKEAQRLAKLSPAQQAKWFGIEEARLTAEAGTAEDEPSNDKPKIPITKAPKPASHNAKGGGNAGSVTSDTPDFAAFEKLAQQAD